MTGVQTCALPICFALKMFWRRLRGGNMGFGAASVSFGRPLSLRSEPDVGTVEDLAAALKARVEQSMPVFGVPLLAHLFLEADGPLTDDEIVTRAAALFARTIGTRPRVSHDSFPGFVTAARDQRQGGGMITQTDDHWAIVPDERPLLRFYANAIQFAPDTGNAATAKS